MTVNTTKITAGPYNGNGLSSTFSYGFKIDDESELNVYQTDDTGEQFLLTLTTDYTVSGVGNSTGGLVTLVTGALPTNYVLYIRLSLEVTQDTSFESQGAFFPDVHESAFDKLTRLAQLITDKVNRTMSVSDSYTGDLPITMEDPDAGKTLRWNEDATGIENFDADATYVNIDGDTMLSPLAGPDPENDDDYINKGYAEDRYVNVTGDTMISPLAGPASVNPNDYVPQFQIADVVDARIASIPGFDPQQLIDYGLVASVVTDELDYGSVA